MENGLYVTATPIGNLSDISERAVSIFTECEVIFAEDTRHTKNLLRMLGINKRRDCFISLHKFNESKRAAELRTNELKDTVAVLVTDAGTPSISDPGATLISKYHEEKVPVFSVPGCCSITAAFSISGFELRPEAYFSFFGFFPRKQTEQTSLLEEITYRKSFSIFFESGKRITNTLEVIQKFFKCEIPAFLVKELTKKHEMYWKGSITELTKVFSETNNPADILKGEFVLILDLTKLHKLKNLPSNEIESWINALQPFMKKSDIAKVLKIKYGVKRNDLYNHILIRKN